MQYRARNSRELSGKTDQILKSASATGTTLKVAISVERKHPFCESRRMNSHIPYFSTWPYYFPFVKGYCSLTFAISVRPSWLLRAHTDHNLQFWIQKKVEKEDWISHERSETTKTSEAA